MTTKARQQHRSARAPRSLRRAGGPARLLTAMQLDLAALEDLRNRHPAWRLLHYERAPLAVAFMQAAFVATNTRALPEDEAVELLEDHLFAAREQGIVAPRSAREYLSEWASDERGFLRRFYPVGQHEAFVALTPGVARALTFLVSLQETEFVGTESRLLTAVELLRQLDLGTDPNVENRLADLGRRRAEIDAEIERVLSGDARLLDDRAVVERFHQFAALARELLADFREVEDNFRRLDRSVRERIANWDGSKAELLDDVFGARDLIAGSDQGASFRAFWEFLMSLSRQEELSARLDRVMALPAVAALSPDRRLRRVHHDWLDAGEETQRTVALLSSQLRRFLDDKAWLENRRIVEILRSIESSALAVRDRQPAGDFATIDQPRINVSLPMERRLALAVAQTVIVPQELLHDDEADLAKLFADEGVDLAKLADHIDTTLGEVGQVTLAEVCDAHPLIAGLAELLGYLQLDDHRFVAAVVEDQVDRISWPVERADPAADDADAVRTVEMPRVVFAR